MSKLDSELVLNKKTEEIKKVLGLSDAEYDSLFAESNKEIMEYFQKEHFNEEDKIAMREIFNLPNTHEEALPSSLSLKR